MSYFLYNSFYSKIKLVQSDDEDNVVGQSSAANVDVTSKDHVFIAHVPVPSQKEVNIY